MDTSAAKSVSARALTGCRHRLALEARADPAALTPDPGAVLRQEAAAAHRAAVRDRLAASAPLAVIAPGPDALARTRAAIADRVPRIWGAALPRVNGRSGHVELLQWVGDGYVPVLVVGHKVLDRGSGALISAIDRWDPAPDDAVKPRGHRGDAMRLAHLTRMLQDTGAASSSLLGGVIGVDGERLLVQDVEPLLQGYDERFADRLAILRGEVATAPSRIAECRRCPWWPQCEAELSAKRDVGLVADQTSARALAGVGVVTVDGLAAYDGPAPEDLLVPLRDLQALARAWIAGVTLVRRIPEVRVRRADVEVDVDMESFGEDGAYLWGTWLRRDGLDLGYLSFVTWDPVPTRDEARSFGAFWSWLMDRRAEAHASGRTFAAYCYSQQAENKWLLASADRFAGEPGVPTRRAVEEFIASPEWVDMFVAVGDSFLSLVGRGLKKVAPAAGFAWRDPEAGGEASMAWYLIASGREPGHDDAERAGQRERILQYNEDDVRATRTLREWMCSAAMDALPVV
ncbi:TM0106 family RecB-like putative nuclease [Tsukamurella sp. 8F]|uniref:TM0106 family RecB-like putative nuclease n=1 Tax=unclassified Tsukamurella TaxID=2633480 RepID=UPI0023B95E15|nr:MULTISPECIES: TM0106 family RecB-like putative nuclease [unclassified Tsukamurella]MDF0530591.1 TM0106 family RecB-like putative nuclease [Tsukamurella sp. 8J]MDF0587792.1 TM0106 family RecB-like putative nuclease [Tsukamurella sp. 8F]